MSDRLGTAVWLVAPGHAEHRAEALRLLGPDDLEIRTHFSALSHGTERLAFRGEINPDLGLDLPSFGGSFAYPLKYGYASVGIVESTGAAVESIAPGDPVFALHPHQDRYVVDASLVTKLPSHVPMERGVFFAQLETALNVLLDAAPRIGESVVVMGQGVVGLLITALLARMDLQHVIAVDPVPWRRSLALKLGATHALSTDTELSQTVNGLTSGRGADIVIEISGAPAALDQAISCTATQGTIVVASWYGTKRVSIDLGGAFHRRRLRIVSSQVGMLNPVLAPRWDRQRRSETVCGYLGRVELESLISHRIPFGRAAEAYGLIDAPPDDLVQVLLTYEP